MTTNNQFSNDVKKRAEESICNLDHSRAMKDDLIRDLLAENKRLEEHITKLQAENAYVNDMIDNAHNRSKLLESRIAAAALAGEVAK